MGFNIFIFKCRIISAGNQKLLFIVEGVQGNNGSKQFQAGDSEKKILLMSGIYDKYVLLEDTSLFWEAWDKPRRLLFRYGHSGIIFCKKAIRKASLDFLENAL